METKGDVKKMIFTSPSLVTSQWKPADAGEIKALWMIFSPPVVYNRYGKNILARPRNTKNPHTSVKVVMKMLEATAGS